MNTQHRLVRCPKCRKVLPEPPNVPVYKCGSCSTVLQAKKRKNETVDSASPRLEENSSGKVSNDHEASSSTNHSINEPDRKISDHKDSDLSDHEDPESSNKPTVENGMKLGQDVDETPENCSINAAESSGKGKMEQLSDDQDGCSTSNQQLLVTSIDEPNRNDPRSSTELSGHEDPESSPEQDHDLDATKNPSRTRSPESSSHDGTDQDREQGRFTINGVSENCNNEVEFEESSRELTESPEKRSFSIEETSRDSIGKKIVRDCDGGLKSSFKNLIAEKLLDTRPRKKAYVDEDDMLSEDGSADLFHRPRFERISSEETLENARVGGTGYYDYEGSISSFDGYDNQIQTKKHSDSGNEYHHKQRRETFHHSKGRRGKEEHRSPEFRSVYRSAGRTNVSRGEMNEFHHNPRHRLPPIPGNVKMERLELLKMVRQLQDQLERTNVSNAVHQAPYGLNHGGRYGQRMAFSGEAVRRDGGSDFCHHCCPQDRHFSAQLPRQHVCCNGPHYVPSTCYSSHCSGPSSPLHHSEPEVSSLVRIKPETDGPKKRYVRPVAGGSPWITCYRCSEVLQLPQSLFVFKKRCHSLRCGGCMKVLNFMLSDGTHVHRYYPEETIAAPPSSEVEDYVGPVSCSDRSFQKSYSTETDRNGSREFGEERRRAAMLTGTGPSSSSRTRGRRKVTSEIEEVEPGPNGSPLHWLMGYASPSKVIRG